MAGIKPLEIRRNGGGKAPDFALSMVMYQHDFADSPILGKAAQT